MFQKRFGIIIACDVETLQQLEELVKISCKFNEVVGLKIGFSLALRFGLPICVRVVRENTDVIIIYDHQKGGTDIPQLGKSFARCCADARIDGVILFPHAGPVTLSAFVSEIFSMGMTPIVGGFMTHAKYLDVDGGYIANTAPVRIYRAAMAEGVTHFVVPGNKPDILEQLVRDISPVREPNFLMPGIGTQGGDLDTALRATGGKPSYLIIGSSIYNAPNPEDALAQYASAIRRYIDSE